MVALAAAKGRQHPKHVLPCCSVERLQEPGREEKLAEDAVRHAKRRLDGAKAKAKTARKKQKSLDAEFLKVAGPVSCKMETRELAEKLQAWHKTGLPGCPPRARKARDILIERGQDQLIRHRFLPRWVLREGFEAAEMLAAWGAPSGAHSYVIETACAAPGARSIVHLQALAQASLFHRRAFKAKGQTKAEIQQAWATRRLELEEKKENAEKQREETWSIIRQASKSKAVETRFPGTAPDAVEDMYERMANMERKDLERVVDSFKKDGHAVLEQLVAEYPDEWVSKRPWFRQTLRGLT